MQITHSLLTCCMLLDNIFRRRSWLQNKQIKAVGGTWAKYVPWVILSASTPLYLFGIVAVNLQCTNYLYLCSSHPTIRSRKNNNPAAKCKWGLRFSFLSVCVCVCVCSTILVSTRSPHKNSKPTKIQRSEDI